MTIKPAWILAVIGVGLLALPTSVVAIESERTKPQPVVVLELFTSQGCSSCPPADELLSQINNLNEEHKLPVVCLSFHVDYWNCLGWSDPYSKAQFTERQRDYARAFESRRVYTPQLIVNGQIEFVGSKASAAREAIRKALEVPARVQVELKAKWEESKSLANVEYSLRGDFKESVLNVAVVQKLGENPVPRGENAGRALAHVNIVRELQTLAIKQRSGRVSIDLPKGL